MKAGYIGMIFVIRKASYFASAEELNSENRETKISIKRRISENMF